MKRVKTYCAISTTLREISKRGNILENQTKFTAAQAAIEE